MTSPTKILIVEDNAPTRALIKSYVEKADYITAQASDGEEALEIIKQEKPDLILLDLQMQPVGGLKFMRRIIGTEYEVPAILITGDPSVDILNQAQKLGIKSVIRKPIEEKKLLSHIERLLTKKA